METTDEEIFGYGGVPNLLGAVGTRDAKLEQLKRMRKKEVKQL